MEVEEFLQVVKDELDLEISSLVLFPLDQANLTDAILG